MRRATSSLERDWQLHSVAGRCLCFHALALWSAQTSSLWWNRRSPFWGWLSSSPLSQEHTFNSKQQSAKRQHGDPSLLTSPSKWATEHEGHYLLLAPPCINWYTLISFGLTVCLYASMEWGGWRHRQETSGGLQTPFLDTFRLTLC